MVSMRKKSRNITPSYHSRIPDLMRWITVGSSLGIKIVGDSVTSEPRDIGGGNIIVVTESGLLSSSPSTDVAFVE